MLRDIDFTFLMLGQLCKIGIRFTNLTLLHLERPKLYGVLAILSAIELTQVTMLSSQTRYLILGLIFLGGGRRGEQTPEKEYR